jgi:hypothetical protein
MMPDPLTAAANAHSPDADRAGPDAPLPEWVVHLLALVIRFILQCSHVGRSHRSRLPSWWHQRPDLPPGSIQALAASIRGEFGNAIAWMCRRRGIGPGHPDWPELSRAIVAFGGGVKGARPGLPACGLQWWENPDLVPGMSGETATQPATTALAVLLSRQAVANTPPPAPTVEPAAPGPALPPAIRRQVFARTATGPPTHPPTGPPANWGHQPVTSDERGQPMAGPAVLIRADRIPLPCLTRQPVRMLRRIPALSGASPHYERVMALARPSLILCVVISCAAKRDAGETSQPLTGAALPMEPDRAPAPAASHATHHCLPYRETRRSRDTTDPTTTTLAMLAQSSSTPGALSPHAPPARNDRRTVAAAPRAPDNTSRTTEETSPWAS